MTDESDGKHTHDRRTLVITLHASQNSIQTPFSHHFDP